MAVRAKSPDQTVVFDAALWTSADGDVRTPFRGGWRVERRILDFAAGGVARFSGEAEIRPGADAWRYVEAGTLDLGETRVRAERAYRWAAVGPGEIAVRFEEGGLLGLYAFDAHGLAIAEPHLCGSDRYAGRIFRPAADRWRWRWRVRGPRKDYLMIGDYRRAAGQVAAGGAGSRPTET